MHHDSDAPRPNSPLDQKCPLNPRETLWAHTAEISSPSMCPSRTSPCATPAGYVSCPVPALGRIGPTPPEGPKRKSALSASLALSLPLSLPLPLPLPHSASSPPAQQSLPARACAPNIARHVRAHPQQEARLDHCPVCLASKRVSAADPPRTPQNTPATVAPISSRAQQPGVTSIKEGASVSSARLAANVRGQSRTRWRAWPPTPPCWP